MISPQRSGSDRFEQLHEVWGDRQQKPVVERPVLAVAVCLALILLAVGGAIALLVTGHPLGVFLLLLAALVPAWSWGNAAGYEQGYTDGYRRVRSDAPRSASRRG